MLNARDILETITMIQDEHLDVRTITMGISLLDCCHSDIDTMCGRVYDKITRKAKDLVKTGEQIEKELGRPLTDSEIFGFAQINSEHCRHKIFCGTFIARA